MERKTVRPATTTPKVGGDVDPSVTLLIYGAYGYTGELISRAAVDRGRSPILAGRDGDRLRKLGRELRADVREFDLSVPEFVAESIRDVDLVLNCAGPFVATADPLVDACLETGVDYLDVTGEYAVLAAIADRSAEAAAADVTLLPAVGFDVVATDCLAADLVERLPEATTLVLGVEATGSISRGTARTGVRGLGVGPRIRRNGDLVRPDDGARARRLDFGRGERPALAVAWADLVTATHTTGIENVAVYVALDPFTMRAVRFTRPLTPLLRTRPVQWLLDRMAAARFEGPSPAERERSEMFVYGEACTAYEACLGGAEGHGGPRSDGDRIVARLRTPDPYDVTIETALAAVERVAAGDAPVGFTTPAGAFGPSFIDVVDGVERLDH
ncbi:saccharopine dehydrogenase family protein [Halorubrum vacuolatum]|uniref:Uncharacterized conserved protein n=1 Tax=Halorubrum vacuolatum TaxID=63740 RepID=A0A238VMT5_HALVU|nr:saccharopine dehydrogenase NADP-binding domain-containing protein [Halorubrum vacuolatum]SNR35528.1 Uncharacterized conserved protein [Halorubrum vacuolatum]